MDHTVSFLCTHSATTKTYTLSLHDALPISAVEQGHGDRRCRRDTEARRESRVGRGIDGDSDEEQVTGHVREGLLSLGPVDRKSTRLNSSHITISYAVFCLKKKKERNGI